MGMEISPGCANSKILYFVTPAQPAIMKIYIKIPFTISALNLLKG